MRGNKYRRKGGIETKGLSDEETKRPRDGGLRIRRSLAAARDDMAYVGDKGRKKGI